MFLLPGQKAKGAEKHRDVDGVEWLVIECRGVPLQPTRGSDGERRELSEWANF